MLLLNNSISTHVHSNDWKKATGPVPIRMSNDYLFRALLQQNNHVLKALVASLLHLELNSISTIVITNPIQLGNSIHAKDFVLDIHAILNNNTSLNLEMQVINEYNWPDRSLSYLCRSFDNLNKGEDYFNVKPAIQIGLLNFTLFKDSPEFFATYKLLNVKNHRIYSDKLQLSVLDLTQINLATEEDKYYGSDRWAALFNASNWEEIHMIAQSDPNIQAAAETVYYLSQEEQIRQQCEAREEFYRRQRTTEKYMEHLASENEQLEEEIHRLKALLAQNGISENED